MPLVKTETMLPQKQAEEAIVPNFNETEHEGKEEERDEEHSMLSVKNLLWHGGSAWDAWFSCASNQVIQLNPQIKIHYQTLSVLNFVFCVSVFSGSTSAFNSTLFVLSTGTAIRHIASGILWTNGKLDRIFD